MPVTRNGTIYGCSYALEQRSAGLASAGRELRDILQQGGTLPTTYTIKGEVFAVKIITVASHDGVGDNQTDLSSALGAARGGTPTMVVLPPSATPYRHSGTLDLSADTYLLAYGATLMPLGIGHSRVYFGQSRAGVLGPLLRGPNAEYSRWPERFEDNNFDSSGGKDGSVAGQSGVSGAESTRLCAVRVRDIIVNDVKMRGAIEAALWFMNVDNFLIENSSVFRSHSDGFHITKDTSFGTLRNCHAHWTGDDAFSFIQYAQASGQPRNMLIEDCVNNGNRARGFTTVSGRDLYFRRCVATHVTGAPFRFGPTSAHSNADTHGIILEDCEAWRCPQNDETNNHSAPLVLLLSTGAHACTGVEIVRTQGLLYNENPGVGTSVVREVNGGSSIEFTADGASFVEQLDASD